MKKLLDGNHHNQRSALILKLLSFVAFTFFVLTIWLLYIDADLGLKVIWYIIIPLAPAIFLLIPNLWTALCPLAFVQSLPKRLGINNDRYLNRRQTKYLNLSGIALLYLLVPARYFIFNIEGEISFYTLLVLLLLSLGFGWINSGLSGWCMGLCPIRPVEMLYGQFNTEKLRPEVCTVCDLCVSNCPRLYVNDQEKITQYNSEFLWFIYSFPGFIVGFYIIHPNELFYYIYLKIFVLTFFSYLVFKGIDKLLKRNDALYIAIILSFILYYINILPKVADVWFINDRYQSLLYIIPISAIIYSVLHVLPKDKKMRVVVAVASLAFIYINVTAYFERQQFDLNHYNWQEHAHKVGSEACRPCHASIYNQYTASEMGTSFSLMSTQHSDLPIESSSVYDSKSDFHYAIEKHDSEFYMTEKRYDEEDKLIHELEFKIDYVIGSGHNTKSFIMNNNGYLFEMPITWYTNKKKWDLSPGYEKYNMRFYRETLQKCINCHTEESTFETHSVNRFLKINHGIDCEKCHGPGSLHIERQNEKRMLGFRAIINPAKDQDQDDMVCYDCHSKKEVDFLEKDDDRMINFTAHSSRLSLSKCFTEGGITCITCHDPHQKYSETINQLNKPCLQCHAKELTKIENHQNNLDCAACHMPRKESADIPHLSPTEHWIKVYDKNSTKYRAGLSKSYLDYIVPESQSKWEKQRAATFLRKYRESIGSVRVRSDTLSLAYSLMKKQVFLTPNEKQLYGTILYFMEHYDAALKQFKNLEKTDLKYFEPNPEYYLFFGKTYFRLNNYLEAERYFEKALAEYPNDILTLLELSYLYYEIQDFEHSLAYCEKILDLNSSYQPALFQKAILYQFGMQDRSKAMAAYNQLLHFFPDDHDGIINAAHLHLEQDNSAKGIILLKRGLKRYPRSQKILANLSRFSYQLNNIQDGVKYMTLLNKYYPQNPFRDSLKLLYNERRIKY